MKLKGLNIHMYMYEYFTNIMNILCSRYIRGSNICNIWTRNKRV